MAFSVRAEIPNGRQLLAELERDVTKQIPFANMLAATRTGQLVKSGQTKVMRQRFDRPTPFTLNSLRLQPATMKRPEARVFFRDFAAKGTPADRYLRPQAYGGERGQKRSERALIARGFMKSSQYAIPAAGAEFDAYGNMKRGQIVKILSDIGAFGEQGYQANRTSSVRSKRKALKSGYFVAQPKGEPAGVWQRKGTAFGQDIRPVLIFTDSAPKYRLRLPFQKIAENIVRANYERVFVQALDEALKTSK